MGKAQSKGGWTFGSPSGHTKRLSSASMQVNVQPPFLRFDGGKRRVIVGLHPTRSDYQVQIWRKGRCRKRLIWDSRANGEWPATDTTRYAYVIVRRGTPMVVPGACGYAMFCGQPQSDDAYPISCAERAKLTKLHLHDTNISSVK